MALWHRELEPYAIVAYGLSDTGLIRQNNEDVWASLPKHHLFVLADGMGGHQAGEVAAREATSYFLAQFQNRCSLSKIEEVEALLRTIIKETNTFIFQLGQTHDLLRGMGTTFCCLYFCEDSALFAHVGDSRIYRIRPTGIDQLTDDHSLLRELMELGQMDGQEDELLYKNIITRAVGTEPEVEPTIGVRKVHIGDLYLLCSDGLSDLLNPEEIHTLLSSSLTIEEKVRLLIAEAKKRGGHDNITVILVEVRGNAEGLSRQ